MREWLLRLLNDLNELLHGGFCFSLKFMPSLEILWLWKLCCSSFRVSWPKRREIGGMSWFVLSKGLNKTFQWLSLISHVVSPRGREEWMNENSWMKTPLLEWPHRRKKTGQTKNVLGERDCLRNPEDKRYLLKGHRVRQINFSIFPLHPYRKTTWG